jgi:putative transposase
MGKYSLERLPYPSDVTDEEWEILEPLIPSEKLGGRPQEIARREIVNAIFFVLRSGCPWRMIPHDLPHWFTAYHYFRLWKQQGIWEQINTARRPRSAYLDGAGGRTSSGRGG